MDFYVYAGLFIGLIGLIIFASWVEISRPRADPPSQIRILIAVAERRSHSMSHVMVQQVIRMAVESQLGIDGLEFIEYSSDHHPAHGGRRLHRMTYLMSTIRLGVQPIGKLQEIQRRISLKGLACSVATDPDVGQACGIDPNI